MSQEYKKRVLDSVPESRRPNYIKAINGDCSPRQAIKAKCQYCVGFEDTVDRVRNCKIDHCPLWQYRPYQDKESEPTQEL